MRRIHILGSTGSIGESTLSLIKEASEEIGIETLVAYQNDQKLIAQARAFLPRRVVIVDEARYQTVKQALSDTSVEVLSGTQGVIDAVQVPVDWTLSAIVGIAGLIPTWHAIKHSKTIAIANKESIVCAGKILQAHAAHYGAELIPVDSEHSAIWQVLNRRHQAEIARVTLTASGGPFLRASRAEMAAATPEQAVRHPNWSMGAKISVDSATMMNKALELIEAHHLFSLSSKQLEVVVHPESIVHGLVEYTDGSTLAQMSYPDMRTPIAVALYHPERHAIEHRPLDWKSCSEWHFEAVDETRFSAIRIAREVMEQSHETAVILNAANEVAVSAFLGKKIGFLSIVDMIEGALSRATPRRCNTVEEVLDYDHEIRSKLCERHAL